MEQPSKDDVPTSSGTQPGQEPPPAPVKQPKKDDVPTSSGAQPGQELSSVEQLKKGNIPTRRGKKEYTILLVGNGPLF